MKGKFNVSWYYNFVLRSFNATGDRFLLFRLLKYLNRHAYLSVSIAPFFAFLLALGTVLSVVISAFTDMAILINLPVGLAFFAIIMIWGYMEENEEYVNNHDIISNSRHLLYSLLIMSTTVFYWVVIFYCGLIVLGLNS